MFRVVFHPSSGAHNTVSTVSGINETVTATCCFRPTTFTTGSSTVSLMPDTADTVSWALCDGWNATRNMLERPTTFTTGSSTVSLMPDTADTVSWAPCDGWNATRNMLERPTTFATGSSTVSLMPDIRVVTGLLTGHNTLRRHIYLLGLFNSPLCRWCGAGEGTSAHVLCECEALASRRYAYLGWLLLPGARGY